MKHYIIAGLCLLSVLCVQARDKVIRPGKIITVTQDTISGLLDISSDFNFKVFYKTDPAKLGFKRIKSREVVKVMYDDKVFERIPFKTEQILALKIVAGKVDLYADFLPGITPGNNSSMFSAVQTSKTRKVYYLVHQNQTHEVSPRNYMETLKTVFADKPELYGEFQDLTYAEVFNNLPVLTLKFNQL